MCHSFKTIKVGDFGISKQLQHTGQKLTTLDAIGYPAYVAIELYKDNKYTTSADIWALGCILYEMVHRRRFFAPDFVAWHPAINWENTKKKVRDYQHQQIKETCPPKIKQTSLRFFMMECIASQKTLSRSFETAAGSRYLFLPCRTRCSSSAFGSKTPKTADALPLP